MDYNYRTLPRVAGDPVPGAKHPMEAYEFPPGTDVYGVPVASKKTVIGVVAETGTELGGLSIPTIYAHASNDKSVVGYLAPDGKAYGSPPQISNGQLVFDGYKGGLAPADSGKL